MKFSAPARIDLAGGTLDVPPLCFLVRRAATLNIAVNRRVTLRRYEQPGRLLHKGRESALVDWPLYSEALAYFDQNPEDFGFAVDNHIPPASGLGGSSSLLVAVVAMLNKSLGVEASKKVLIDQVTVLEHRLLGKPAGTQDGIGAIHGGMSWIHYHRGYPVVEAVTVPEFLKRGPLVLVYSEEQHHSGINNWAVVAKACRGEGETLALLDALADNAHAMKAAVDANDEAAFFATVCEESRLRRALCPEILNQSMAGFAAEMGDAVACKACGAGGGGAMWVYAPGLTRDHVAKAASRNNLETWEVKIDFDGVRQEDA